MPAVSQHVPSSTIHTYPHKADAADPCEPSREWVNQMHAKIEESLSSMVVEAKAHRDDQLRRTVVSVEDRKRIENEYIQAMRNITAIASDALKAEVAEERKRRRKQAELQTLSSTYNKQPVQSIDGFASESPSEVRPFQVDSVPTNEAFPTAPHVQAPVQSSTPSAPQHREEHERSSPRPQSGPRATRRTSDAKSTSSRDLPAEPAPPTRRYTKQGYTAAERSAIAEPEIEPSPDIFDEPEEMTYLPAAAPPRSHRNSIDRPPFVYADRPEGGHPSSLGRSTGSIRSERSIARSPPKGHPDGIWKPTISAGEESGSGSAASKSYSQVGRRGSSASLTSMRSTGSGASIRPSISETIPERTDDVDELVSSEPKPDKRKSSDKPPREKEKRANRRRDSRPPPVDAAPRSYDDPPPSALSPSPGMRPSVGSGSGSSSATMQYATTSSTTMKSRSSKSSFASVEDHYHPERPIKPQSYTDPRLDHQHPPSREAPYAHREQPPYSSRELPQRPLPPRSPYAGDGPEREYTHSPAYGGPPSRPMSTKSPFSEYDYPHSAHAPVSRKPSFNHDERRRDPRWERDRDRDPLPPPPPSHWDEERDREERDRRERERIERDYNARERETQRERERDQRERDLYNDTRQHPNQYSYSSPRSSNPVYSSTSNVAPRHTSHEYLPNDPVYDDRDRAYMYRPRPPSPQPAFYVPPSQSSVDDWDPPRDAGRPIPSRQHSFNRREDPESTGRRMTTGEMDGYSSRYAGVPIPRHTSNLGQPEDPPAWANWVNESGGASGLARRASDAQHRATESSLNFSSTSTRSPPPYQPPPARAAAATAAAAAARKFAQRHSAAHAHGARPHPTPKTVHHLEDDIMYPGQEFYDTDDMAPRPRRRRKPAVVESDGHPSDSDGTDDEEGDSAASEGEDADEEDENEQDDDGYDLHDEDEEEEEEEDEVARDGGDEALYDVKRQTEQWRMARNDASQKLLQAQLGDKRLQVQALDLELETARKQRELEEKEAEVRRKEDQLARKEEEVRRKEAERKRKELEEKEAEIRRKEEEIRMKEAVTKQKELEEKEAEVRRKEEEVRRKEEEAEQKRRDEEEKERERIRMAEELVKQKEEAERKEAEVLRLSQEALKIQEDNKRKAKEARKKELDLKKKEQEAKLKEQKLKEEAEQTRRLREEAEEVARAARERQEQLRQMEEETARKEREVQERERALALREEELRRREAEAQMKQEEVRLKEVEAKLKEAEASRKQQQMKEEERRREREEERQREMLKTEEEKNAKIREEEEAKREDAKREEAKREEARRKESQKREEYRKAAEAKQRMEEEEKRKKAEAEKRKRELFDDELAGLGISVDLDEQAYIIQQANYEQRAAKIISSRAEERKRNDSFGNEGTWPSQFIPSSSPGAASAFPKPSPKPNGFSTVDRGSTTPNSARSATGSAWTTSTGKPFSNASPTSARSSTTAMPAGKPRTGSVSSGTYPTASSPHAGSFSEADHARRQAEFANSQQERFRQEQEMLEAQRQMKSAGRPLSKQEAQRVLDHHERLWSRLAVSDTNGLTWTDFPWPMWKTPSNPDDISSALISAYVLSPLSNKSSKSSKDRVKEHIKKWHPDRFETQHLVRVTESDKEKVKQGAGNVTRYLNDLLKKENENSSSVNIFGD